MGRPAVRGLLERGVKVRAMSRRPELARDLQARGAEVVAGDLSDRASLERACQGVDRVLACAHALMGSGRHRSERVDDAGHRDLVDAALAAGVRRFVYTSALGASPDHPIDFFRTKHRMEQHLLSLQRSGLDLVILRPSAFMEHHAHNFNGQGLLESGKVRLVGPGSKPRNFICAADVARFAVRALLEDPPPFRTLDLMGHDHATNLEVSAMYARTAGLPLRVSHLPAGVARALSVLAAPLHPGFARVMRLLSLPDDAFTERFDGAAELEARHGVRLTRLEDFIRGQVARHRER